MRLTTLSLTLLLLGACKTVTASNISDEQMSDDAHAAPRSSFEVYAKPHFGMYFYGAGDHAVEAVPGQSNPFFDPNKPTLVYFHGWSAGEIKKTLPRSFNLHRDFPIAPDLDLVKVWADKGWNFAFMDWAQFADTEFDSNYIGAVPGKMTYDNAERKIWAPDDAGHLVYHLSDGSAVNADASSVSDILAQKYVAFMNSVAKPGVEVRFFGHSLGGQMAPAVAYKISQLGTAQQPLNQAVLPWRLSLTDPIASNCPHSWLPSTKARKRSVLPTCLGAKASGDWVGERLVDYVQAMKTGPQPVTVDAYRCWAVSSSGLGADQLTALFKEAALVEMKPNTTELDFNGKHAFCLANYLSSMAEAPAYCHLCRW